MDCAWLLWSLLAMPAAAALLCLALRSARGVLAAVAALGPAWGALALTVTAASCRCGPILTAGGWLHFDALSAWHAAVLGLVFGGSSLYSWGYFRDAAASGELSPAAARRFGALWFGAAGTMALVLLSNNLGLMWVGIEATTLLTAFLICIHMTPLSLEATWKYLVVCSVGVAFAFMGTILVGASARQLGLDASEMLLWTRLHEKAHLLAPASMKLAFIFLMVGYGTKAGLAPLHNWLPDAHSQAPAPVSALFSGFMLNAALYCIMRHLPLAEMATGDKGWARDILVLLGLVSLLVAAAFIPAQRDGKRLLAYSSVEHLGVITLGLGLGGLGVFAALWHVLNHAVGKSLAFLAIGRLGQMYGSHDLGRLAGCMRRSPLWAAGFLGGMLALIGVAPFAVFMSEFQILRAAADARAYLPMVLFLLGTGVVFVGALRHAITSVWGTEVIAPRTGRATPADALMVVGAIALLLLLGLWMPAPMRDLLDRAAWAVGGGR